MEIRRLHKQVLHGAMNGSWVEQQEEEYGWTDGWGSCKEISIYLLGYYFDITWICDGGRSGTMEAELDDAFCWYIIYPASDTYSKSCYKNNSIYMQDLELCFFLFQNGRLEVMLHFFVSLFVLLEVFAFLGWFLVLVLILADSKSKGYTMWAR